MKKIDLNTFGHRLKFFMFERELSGKKLSELAGITDTTLSMYATNRRIPPIDVFMRLSKALELSDEEIIEWLKTI